MTPTTTLNVTPFVRSASIRHSVWRNSMPAKLCACCEDRFQPLPQVPNQAYCSKPECQRARRQRWYLQKLQNDPDYRDNKQRTQRGWMDRNPGYWRQYRTDNPEYAERNRNLQRAKSRAPKAEAQVIAKTDVSTWPQVLKTGIYRITPVMRPASSDSDVWTVEISPVCLDGTCKRDVCKGDACKDRT